MKNSLKKKALPKTMENGEIGVIRNILIGEFVAQYESNFESLEELVENNNETTNRRMAKFETSFDQRLKELEKNTTEWFDSYEKSINVRFDKLEALYDKRLKEIENKMVVEKNEDRENISKMLATLSQTLIGK